VLLDHRKTVFCIVFIFARDVIPLRYTL